MKSNYIVMVVSLLFFILPASAIPDNNGTIYDNQTNYSNGIIINQPSLANDNQTNYSNGIIIIKNSVIQDTEATATPTQTTSGSSSGGGSGGGGGGSASSNEDFNNILKHEEHDGTLIAGQPVSFKFNLSVYEVILTGSENEYDVSVRVEMLKNNSKATIKPDGEVLTYFNVVTSSKRLKEAVIRFKVDSPANLVKWNGSEWVRLPMVENVEDIGLKIPQECKDELRICYTYLTPNLSSFAIVKNEQVLVATPTPEQTIVLPAALSTSVPIQSPIPKESPALNGLAASMVIVVVFMLRNKR